MPPDMIHRNTRGARIRRIGNPAGERETAARACVREHFAERRVLRVRLPAAGARGIQGLARDRELLFRCDESLLCLVIHGGHRLALAQLHLRFDKCHLGLNHRRRPLAACRGGSEFVDPLRISVIDVPGHVRRDARMDFFATGACRLQTFGQKGVMHVSRPRSLGIRHVRHGQSLHFAEYSGPERRRITCRRQLHRMNLRHPAAQRSRHSRGERLILFRITIIAALKQVGWSVEHLVVGPCKPVLMNRFFLIQKTLHGRVSRQQIRAHVMRLKEGAEAIVILLRNRIELVIMAARALQR